MKPKKFIVLFEKFEEWNQLEGSWQKEFKGFETKEEAIAWRNAIKENCNYANVSGVYTVVT